MMANQERAIQLYYADSPIIGFPELEKIVQCLALYADTVWLQLGSGISPALQGGDRAFIIDQLRDLVREGFVKLWDFSIERPADHTLGLRDQLRPEPAWIMPRDVYRSLREQVHNKVIDYTQRVDSLLPRGQEDFSPIKPRTLEGLGELVHLRNNLWVSLIGDHLGTDGLLTDQRRIQKFRHEYDILLSGDQAEKPLISEAFDSFAEWQSLTGFAFLKPSDLKDIRKSFPYFREFVLSSIDRSAVRLGDAQKIQRSLDSIKETFARDIAAELERRIPSWWQHVGSQLGTSAISVASFFLPPLGLLSNVQSYVEHLRLRKHKKLHVFYVLELRRRLERKQLRKWLNDGNTRRLRG